MANKPASPKTIAFYAAIDPKKYARNALRVAVDRGEIPRGTSCANADDTCKGRLEAHHDDYAPENWLRVTWLCVSHHRRADKERRAKPMVRVELTTARLRIECSTTELHRHEQTATNHNTTPTAYTGTPQ